MCCLFGLLDYGGTFTGKEKAHILSILGTECEIRGTDATGIAYNHSGRLVVYKRPIPAHRIHFRIPEGTRAIMGHTRMTTQGSEQKNYNNHPFKGSASGRGFALAHNGVLHNDTLLRRSRKLPETRIETDSFVAVQLIEQMKTLDFRSLKVMAEEVEGSFSFTALDAADRLFFVKGDNPLCIYHFPKEGFYLYASTEEILRRATQRLRFSELRREKVPISCGDILRIDDQGKQSRSEFDAGRLYHSWFARQPYALSFDRTCTLPTESEGSYLSELKSVAGYFGYAPEEVDLLLRQGFHPEEIEELFYCGEL